MIFSNTYSRLFSRITVRCRDVHDDRAVRRSLIHRHFIQIPLEYRLELVPQDVHLNINLSRLLRDTLILCCHSQLERNIVEWNANIVQINNEIISLKKERKEIFQKRFTYGLTKEGAERKKSPLGCALALAKGNLWLSSGPMVRHKHSMFTVFLSYKEKELLTGEGCVEMDIPWQLCWTIGPLTLHI